MTTKKYKSIVTNLKIEGWAYIIGKDDQAIDIKKFEKLILLRVKLLVI